MPKRVVIGADGTELEVTRNWRRRIVESHPEGLQRRTSLGFLHIDAAASAVQVAATAESRSVILDRKDNK